MKSRFLTVPVLLAGVAWGQLPDSGGYGGPAVLSRGLGELGQRGNEPVSIRPYARIVGTYDSGLAPVALNQTGDIDNPGGLYGVEADVGVYGTHRWRRSSIGLEYKGVYRHYNANTYYNGSDHILGLEYQRQTSRRTFLTLKQYAGTVSRAVGGILGGFDTQYITSPGVPVNQIFDNRAYFFDSLASFMIQKGARNSFNFSGGGFLVRRQSSVLVGVNGYRASADYARRISRRQTISIAYQYMHFDFPRAFGEADVQGIAVGYSRQFGRYWELATHVGVYRVRSIGVRQITLDRVLADLLGRTTGAEAFNQVNYLPNVLATLRRKFRKSALTLGYTRTVYPGNGILLTSRTESGTANYSYTGIRKWSFGGNGGFYRETGFGKDVGSFNSFGGGLSATYRLIRSTHINMGADFRRYDSNQTNFRRDGARLYVGLAFAPGDIPLSFH